MALPLQQNPLSLSKARGHKLCSSGGLRQKFKAPKMGQKYKSAVRAEDGESASGSWSSRDEFLGDMFREVAEYVFPGSMSSFRQDQSQDVTLALDEYETLIAYVYYADVPGVPRDSLQVPRMP